jgi:hypothetical protein
MDHIRVGDSVSLQLPSQFAGIHERLGTMEGSAVPLLPGILAQQDRGITPTFYTTRMPLGDVVEQLRPGVSGEAKIFSRRCSLAEGYLPPSAT